MAKADDVEFYPARRAQSHTPTWLPVPAGFRPILIVAKTITELRDEKGRIVLERGNRLEDTCTSCST